MWGMGVGGPSPQKELVVLASATEVRARGGREKESEGKGVRYPVLNSVLASSNSEALFSSLFFPVRVSISSELF